MFQIIFSVTALTCALRAGDMKCLAMRTLSFITCNSAGFGLWEKNQSRVDGG